MPFCPKCKAEYNEGIKICSTCKLELVPSLEGIKEIYTREDAEKYLQGKELVPVASCFFEDAKIIEATLLDAGVACSIVPLEGESAGYAERFAVVVAKEDVE